VKKAFSVTALVSSLNKPAKAEHVLVMADDEDDAKRQAKNKVQRKHPDGSVQIGTVRE
jgi:hypothetical protein